MKNRIALALVMMLGILPCQGISRDLLPEKPKAPAGDAGTPAVKISSNRGLFVSLIQDPPVLASHEAMLQLVDFAKRAGVTILFVQIYRANQSWFASQVADPTPYDDAFDALGEDPLVLLIREAHGAGIEVHAWLNMLSLSANEKAPLLKKYGPGILTTNLEKKGKLKDYKIDSQYFLEPGDPRVRQELVAMVGEIVEAYPGLDGLQFDYIRYPDTQPHYGYTEANVARFKEATGIEKIEEGSQVWNDWKRAQVTELLRMLAQKARDIRPDIQISATGCMSYARALHEAFQDWPSWVDDGLVDFVTVMNYSPDPEQYGRWNTFVKTKVRDPGKLYFGVGAYKFLKRPGIFETEFRSCERSGATLCAVLHYGSLLENPELQNPLLTSESKSVA